MKLLTSYFNKQTRIFSIRLLGPKHGFTLIELLIVMGVIGTLAAGLVTIINPANLLAKARDAERKSDLEQIQYALEAYYDDYNTYPDSDANYTIDSVSWGGDWSPYMSLVPEDSHANYRYVYYSTGQSYRLYAHLEVASDPQACSPTSDCPNVATSGIASPRCGVSVAHTCNYGVSSPNTSP